MHIRGIAITKIMSIHWLTQLLTVTRLVILLIKQIQNFGSLSIGGGFYQNLISGRIALQHLATIRAKHGRGSAC